MPLPVLKVEPFKVSSRTLPKDKSVADDLEAVANGTLSNIIRQLSALSTHATEIFTDLVFTATEISKRAQNLKGRLDVLAVNMNGIIESTELLSLKECNNLVPFQNSVTFDQKILSRTTMRPGMLKVHTKCDILPPFEILDPYRNDGKNGFAFYSNPNYFFDFWREEMLKDTGRSGRKHGLPTSKPTETGDGIISQEIPSQESDMSPIENNSPSVGSEPAKMLMKKNSRRDTLPPPPPPPMVGADPGNIAPPPPGMYNRISQLSFSPSIKDIDEYLPPPPPPPTSDGFQINQNHYLQKLPADNLKPSTGPPPPPPPPMNLAIPAPPPPPPMSEPAIGGAGVVKQKRVIEQPAVDPRSNLLNAIRSGVALKKVDPMVRESKANSVLSDVTAILRRRVALEISDSDSDTNDEDTNDDWDEHE